MTVRLAPVNIKIFSWFYFGNTQSVCLFLAINRNFSWAA
jgi:hypothetical protein